MRNKSFENEITFACSLGEALDIQDILTNLFPTFIQNLSAKLQFCECIHSLLDRITNTVRNVCARKYIANTCNFAFDQWYENAASYKENTTQRLVTNKNNPVRCSFVFSAGHHQPYLAAIQTGRQQAGVFRYYICEEISISADSMPRDRYTTQSASSYTSPCSEWM